MFRTSLVLLLAALHAGLACFSSEPDPHITYPTEKIIEVQPGETITLKCESYFKLEWIPPIKADDRTEVVEVLPPGHASVELYKSTFTRTAATFEDTGDYYCVHGWGEEKGDNSDRVHVHVIGTPQLTSTEISAENNEVNSLRNIYLDYEFVGSNFQITCRARTENKNFHMFWKAPIKRNRKFDQKAIHLERFPIENRDGNMIAVHRMTVFNVSPKQNGEYRCTIIHDSGREDSASLMLTGYDVQFLDENTRTDVSEEP